MKTLVPIEDSITKGVYALVVDKGDAETVEHLCEVLVKLVESLPKSKQKAFLQSFEAGIGNKVKVTVKNILTGQDVVIRWDELGGPCDPSTERYHCM